MERKTEFSFNWKGVLLWSAIFYFIGDPLRDFILRGDTSSFLELYTTKDVLLTLSGLMSFSLYAILAYLSMHLFYAQKKWLYLVLGLLISMLFPIFFRNLLEQKIFLWLFDIQNYFGHTLGSYIQDNLYYSFKYLGVGIGYFLVTYSFFKEKSASQLEVENQKMALAHLRSQVNPHFLLNSLNNIYSLIYQKSDKALLAIDRLSDLLKYSLYSKKDEVLIKEELDHLSKYIDLQSMRYDYPINVDKEIDPSALELRIPQLLILPLIENAFKHGNLKEEPILLKIIKAESTLDITVQNKIARQEKDKTAGIGLSNVKQRLELFYEGTANFETKEKEGYFYVQMKIPLS